MNIRRMLHVSLVVMLWCSVATGLDVSFGPPTTFPAQIYVSGIKTADFNHDGNLDIVVVEGEPNTVALFLGDGSGLFGPPARSSMASVTGAYPSTIAVGDFNGDTHPDVAVAHAGTTGRPNGFGNQVTIHLGNGIGGFIAPPLVFSTGGSNTGLASGDLNGDGKDDLVVGAMDTGRVYSYLSNGNGTFTLVASYDTGAPYGGKACCIALADFNMDGKVDVVAGNHTGYVSMFLGSGTGLLTPSGTFTTGARGGGVAAGDFTNDGKVDVVESTQAGPVVFRGDGLGGLMAMPPFPGILDGGDLAHADFDGDGNLDIVIVRGTAGSFSFVRGDGNGQFLSSADFPMGVYIPYITAGDFNGDGRIDVAVSDGSASNPGFVVRLNNTAPPIPPPSSFCEEFSATALDPAWSIRPGIGTYSLSDNPGFLRYGLAGSTHPDKAALWIYRPFSGSNWTLETRAWYYLPYGNGRQFVVRIPLGDLSQRGLNEVMWWRTADQAGGDPGDGRYVVAFADGGTIFSTWPGSPASGAATYSLRIQRSGQDVSVQMSTDGFAWTTVAQHTFTTALGPLQNVLLEGWNFAGSGYADYDRICVNAGAVDTTPPIITPTISGTLGNNGWYVGDVTVTWAVSDPDSAISSSTGCDPVTLSADTAGTTLSCTATSAGGTSSQSVIVKLDRTPPTIAGSRDPAPNAAGWNNTDVAVTFTCADAGSGPVAISSTSIVSIEGANQSVPGAYYDLAGNSSAAAIGGISIDKHPPAVSNLTASPNPQQVNSPVSLTASLADTGPSGLAAWHYTIDGGPGSVQAVTGPFANVSASITLTTLGVYTVCARASDAAANSSADECLYVVAYDPDGGFVTGGGWIDSPLGAYAANPTMTGRANFGFLSKYLRGATTPSGQTEFQFKAGSLNFASASYEWLVVAGARAQFKGTGTISGVGSYGFMLTAIDGQLNPGGGVDKFRIKIWDPVTSSVVYDNQMGEEDGADPTTTLGGGSIVIHPR